MLTFTQKEFDKVKDNYKGLTFVKTDKNGSQYYAALAECDRCMGQKIVYKGRLNGKLVPHTPDNGVCWKCMGTGAMPVKIKIITEEHAAELAHRQEVRIAKHQVEFEARCAETRERTRSHNLELGYKPIDFTVDDWVSMPSSKYIYYRVVVETKKAVLLNFLQDLYDSDSGAIDRWIPIKAIHYKNS